MSSFSWHVRADDLSSDMSLQGLVVQCLHGGHEQCDREEALQDFKDGMEQEAEMSFLINRLSLPLMEETEMVFMGAFILFLII